MNRPFPWLAVALCLAAAPLAAQEVGTASGRGTIDKQIGWDDAKKEAKIEVVPFSPRYSFAYTAKSGPDTSTFLVLTEKEPPLKSWSGAKDRAEARRLWCEKEKTSFVAVELNDKGGVELFFLCPANGKLNTEMLSSWNGLQSVVVKLEGKSDKRLKGTLRGGKGACPGKDGADVYCTPQSDYVFDAPLVK